LVSNRTHSRKIMALKHAPDGGATWPGAARGKTIHVIVDVPVAGPAHRRAGSGAHGPGKGKSVTFSLPATPSRMQGLAGAPAEEGPGTERASPVGTVSLGYVKAPPSPVGFERRGSMALCPCCGVATLSGVDGNVARVEGSCDNRRWGWNGEPTFCCLCASLKGLGSLSHFGCEPCKVQRARFYKRRNFFSTECKHCGTDRRHHETYGHGQLASKYPRCPISRALSPACDVGPQQPAHALAQAVVAQ